MQSDLNLPWACMSEGSLGSVDASKFQVMILITGTHKAYALHKAIEGGISHMFTVSAFQQHPTTLFLCDEDATLELKVKTVKYFKGLNYVHDKLVEDPPKKES